jgi:hypothetical protein
MPNVEMSPERKCLLCRQNQVKPAYFDILCSSKDILSTFPTQCTHVCYFWVKILVWKCFASALIFYACIHTFIALTLDTRRGSRVRYQIFLRDTHTLPKLLATRNMIAIGLQMVSPGTGLSAVNPLVTFYDIHGRKGEVLYFCSIPDTTRDSWTPH